MSGQVYHLKASYRLGAALSLLQGLTVVCIAMLAWPWWLKTGLFLLSFLYFIRLIRLHVLRNGPKAILTFWNKEKGIWQMTSVLQPIRTVILSKHNLCTRHIVILHFKDLGYNSGYSPNGLFILVDSLKEQEFKSLRRQLRMLS